MTTTSTLAMFPFVTEGRAISCSTGPSPILPAAGDKPGVSYPSAAPSVVSAGGTTINRDSLGNFLYESAWRLTGGGPSAYEPLPPYQGYLSAVQFAGSLTKRATPDLGCVAD